MSLIPGSGRYSGRGNDNPFRYSWATVHRVAKQLDTTEHTHTHIHPQHSKVKRILEEAFVILSSGHCMTEWPQQLYNVCYL